MFTIGALAKRARVTADTIRLYERQGLIAASGRTTSGYRLYDDTALRRLVFIRCAQRCGFTLAEIGELLRAPDGHASSAQTYHLAVDKMGEVDDMMKALRTMSGALASYIAEYKKQGAPATRMERLDHPLLAAFDACVSRLSGATGAASAA